MKNKIFLMVTIFLITIGIATAILIDEKEKLGPYDKDHRYYVHVYNVDDIASATVNGKLVVQKKFNEDSGWIEITDEIQKGKNTIEFDLENLIGGWTYGFEIRQDDSNIIFQDSCGVIWYVGCMNYDDTIGLVYRNVVTIVSTGKK